MKSVKLFDIIFFFLYNLKSKVGGAMRIVEKGNVGFNIRKSTLLVLAALYLMVGFLGGIIFKSLESQSYIEMRELMAQQKAAADLKAQAQGFDPVFSFTWKVFNNPGDPDAWTELGLALRRVDRPRDAVRAFDKAVAADPEHQASRLLKGLVLQEDLKDRKNALKSWRELLEINPDAKTPDGRAVKDLVAGKRPPN